jgi:hypothetical protein
VAKSNGLFKKALTSIKWWTKLLLTGQVNPSTKRTILMLTLLSLVSSYEEISDRIDREWIGLWPIVEWIADNIQNTIKEVLDWKNLPDKLKGLIEWFIFARSWKLWLLVLGAEGVVQHKEELLKQVDNFWNQSEYEKNFSTQQ